jgi:7,8-dihydro-6-hydroxymethylpterin-pyrophosphokinase
MQPLETEEAARESRQLAISIRAFYGSRTALLTLAKRMLVASHEFEFAGAVSDYSCFEDEQQGEFLAVAILYRSRLPVEGVLERVRTVERSLQDPEGSPLRPVIELRLLWMEGVHIQTPELTLPSPLLETQRWASLVFVEAAEDALVDAMEQGTESKSVVEKIAAAYVHLKKVSPGAKWFL